MVMLTLRHLDDSISGARENLIILRKNFGRWKRTGEMVGYLNRGPNDFGLAFFLRVHKRASAIG